jgi:hypothetical protein
VIGITGVFVILFLWSFKFLWAGLESSLSMTSFYVPVPYILTIFLFINIAIAWLLAKKFRDTSWKNSVVEMSFSVFVIVLVFCRPNISLGILAINLWILFLSITYILRGSRDNHLGLLNFGLSILGILALCRFFDESIPFVWRGVFFLLTGIAFFVMNAIVMKRRKALNTSL